MPLNESALLGIACLITNSPSEESEALRKSLSFEQQAVVQQIVENKLCIPENLQKILEDGRKELEQGAVLDQRALVQPTWRTYENAEVAE